MNRNINLLQKMINRGLQRQALKMKKAKKRHEQRKRAKKAQQAARRRAK